MYRIKPFHGEDGYIKEENLPKNMYKMPFLYDKMNTSLNGQIKSHVLTQKDDPKVDRELDDIIIAQKDLLERINALEKRFVQLKININSGDENTKKMVTNKVIESKSSTVNTNSKGGNACKCPCSSLRGYSIIADVDNPPDDILKLCKWLQATFSNTNLEVDCHLHSSTMDGNYGSILDKWSLVTLSNQSNRSYGIRISLILTKSSIADPILTLHPNSGAKATGVTNIVKYILRVYCHISGFKIQITNEQLEGKQCYHIIDDQYACINK